MNRMPLISKQSFIGLDDSTWLYSGAETPPLRGSIEAMVEYMENRAKGPGGRNRNDEVEQSLRQNLASMLNGKPENIALLSNASEGISHIVHSLGLREGDNVIFNTLEFPSGIFPLLLLREKGIEVRQVEHKNWKIEVDDVMNLVDSRTRLVMTSHVSFVSGTRFDYKALYEALKSTEALLFLDATQSLGAIPVNLQYTDFVVCSSYKWLMSVHGLGILGINPARTSGLIPASAGWRSVTELFHPGRFTTIQLHSDARRFELGYPSYPSIYAMNASTNTILQTGIDRIEQHILALGTMLIEQLQRLGFDVMTPHEPEWRAGNISFVCERGEELAELLADQRIYVWGGDGRVRASIHCFNSDADIRKLVHWLSKLQVRSIR